MNSIQDSCSDVAKDCRKPRKERHYVRVTAGSRALADIVAAVPVKLDQTTLCRGRSTAAEQTIDT